MKRSLLILVLTLSSCVTATKDKLNAAGGKGAYKGRDFTVVWNNEKSFREFMLMVATGFTAGASAYSNAAAETTSQVASTNAAKVASTQAKANAATAINASNNATKVSLKALEVAPPVAP